jgi:hypothetical protein
MADTPEKLVFKAKNWQIALSYGLFLSLVCFVLVGILYNLFEKRNAGKNWDINAMQVGLFSLFAIRFGWAFFSKIGSRIEIDDESVRLLSWFGRVSRGGRFQDVSSLGINQTFFKAPRSLVVMFESGKPLRIDGEYEGLGELVIAIEERSGKEFKLIPWG